MLSRQCSLKSEFTLFATHSAFLDTRKSYQTDLHDIFEHIMLSMVSSTLPLQTV